MTNQYDDKNAITPAQIMRKLKTAFSTDPKANPGETHRFLTATSDPEFEDQITAFNKNRRKEDDPAFEAMKVKESIVDQSEISVEVANMRRTKDNKFQCESVHTAGWHNGRLHISPPVLAKNASREAATQTHAKFAFGALAAADEGSVVRHGGSGYAKVDAELDKRLPGNDNPIISPREVGEIRTIGGGHKERITIVDPKEPISLNPQNAGWNRFRALVIDATLQKLGNALGKLKNGFSYVVRGIRVTRYSARWTPPAGETGTPDVD